MLNGRLFTLLVGKCTEIFSLLTIVPFDRLSFIASFSTLSSPSFLFGI